LTPCVILYHVELLARISVELEGAAARPLRHYVAVLGTGVREAMAGVMGSVRELNTCELAGHPFFKRGEFKEALVRQELVGAHILEMLREMHSFAPTLGDKDVPSAPSKRRLQEVGTPRVIFSHRISVCSLSLSFSWC
jgi:hypothetical protein